MTTYAEYQKQIVELQAMAAEVRKVEVDKALAQIHELMAVHGLTLDDLAPPSTRKQRDPNKPRKPVEVKFRDPESGQTWTGRGLAPAWIAGKDRATFAVQT